MAEKEFKFKGTKLTFEFETEEQANFFKTWLCEVGEQDYWLSEEDRFDRLSRFDYWTGDTVKVTLGDSEETEDEDG